MGAQDDPRAGEVPHLPSTPRTPGAPLRRTVVVFDYYHMGFAAEALEYADAAVDELLGAGEEQMIIALGESLTVEQPFTSDPAALKSTLERMLNDPRLYAGNYGRLTERRFFERIESLLDLLEQYPGRKTVLLFSGPFTEDGFFYDNELAHLGGMSAQARTSIYPIDSGGMYSILDPRDSGTSGPPMLRRLANETGGRMTANTNDLNLAYRRAQRDRGCSYTLGFYDRSPRPDKSRRIRVRVNRSWHTAVHSQSYVIRSREKRRQSLMRTASMVPELFLDDSIAANAFVIRPDAANRWESVLATEIRPTPEQLRPDDRPWELRGVVRTPWGTIVSSFRRRVDLPAFRGGIVEVEPVTVFERARLRPGRYHLNVALAHPDASEPLSGTVELWIPEIPREEPFLVGPILGRPPDAEEPVKTRSIVGRVGLEPLLDDRIVEGETISSLVHVCQVDPVSDTPPVERTLRRAMLSDGANVVETFEPEAILLGGRGRVLCQAIIDELPTGELTPGEYLIHAWSGLDRAAEGGRTTLTILPADPGR